MGNSTFIGLLLLSLPFLTGAFFAGNMNIVYEVAHTIQMKCGIIIGSVQEVCHSFPPEACMTFKELKGFCLDLVQRCTQKYFAQNMCHPPPLDGINPLWKALNPNLYLFLRSFEFRDVIVYERMYDKLCYGPGGPLCPLIICLINGGRLINGIPGEKIVQERKIGFQDPVTCRKLTISGVKKPSQPRKKNHDRKTTDWQTTDWGTTDWQTTDWDTTHMETTQVPTTEMETTQAPTTEMETTQAPTTEIETTLAPTTEMETTQAPTTEMETTQAPTTEMETTQTPSTWMETTQAPTTWMETTQAPTTEMETTQAPTTEMETTQAPTTEMETTQAPTTEMETTQAPTTEMETTQANPVACAERCKVHCDMEDRTPDTCPSGQHCCRTNHCNIV